MKRRDFVLAVGGAVVAAPLAAAAQQEHSATIGWLSVFSAPAGATRLAAFRRGLAETGYVEGRNLTLEPRWADNQYDRLPRFAAELVARKVDLIAAFGPPSARAAKAATKTIPIVFGIGTDPVSEGLVASLARPGGNATGFTLLIGELAPKRLELLTELVPHAKSIALLTNPTNPKVDRIPELQHAAREKQLQLQILSASSPNEIDAAFATLVERHVDALIVGIDTLFIRQREQLAALAAHHAVPAIYSFRANAEAGGLISYSIDILAVYRKAGTYAGRILNGEKPADLPVQQPTEFQLTVNLKAAKALGLTLPQSLLARADQVIE